DQRGRFSVPANREARWLIGAAPDPHPTRRRRANEPDDEPTLDFQDDSVPSRGRPADPIDIALDAAQLPMGSAYDLGQDALSEPPDFSPARLAEVDGVYDIVPTPGSDMDVLFDMLADLDEDSVNLYEDITGRIAPAAHAPVPAKPAAKPATSPKAKTSRTKAAEPVTPKPQPAARTSRTRTPSVPSKPDVPAEPLVETTLVEQAVVEDVVIQQPDAQAPVVDQAAAPKARKSRKRAVVPSAWDDILFGTRKND
ncbi:MAG: hypothetical protein FWF75_03740, partial [Propionibacteriaceae bacterium]|nr:hypothetical protein [Propionibacteriaceae bacterium]